MKISVQWSCLLAYSYKKHDEFCQRNKDTVPGTIRHCCLLDSASIHLVAVFTATVLVRRHPFLQGFPSFTSTPLSLLIETFSFSPIKICCPQISLAVRRCVAICNYVQLFLQILDAKSISFMWQKGYFSLSPTHRLTF